MYSVCNIGSSHVLLPFLKVMLLNMYEFSFLRLLGIV